MIQMNMPHSDRKEKRLREVKKTADGNSQFTSKAFQTSFVLCRFKLVLHLDTTAITNQIKYYLTRNRGNFLEMQYGFYGYTLRADLLWLVIERAFVKNSRKAGT